VVEATCPAKKTAISESDPHALATHEQQEHAAHCHQGCSKHVSDQRFRVVGAPAPHRASTCEIQHSNIQTTHRPTTNVDNPLTCETAAARSSTLCTRRRAADPASFLKHNLQCTHSLVRHRMYNIMYHVATHTQSCCLQWYNASKGAQKKQIPMSKNPMKNEKPAGSRTVETVQKWLRSWQQNSRNGSGKWPDECC
jgi:hypothetical protein